ncbi:MAG: Unknown protein [uncultured Sulfurovum sp.]|uniref:Uncharacterized protein n=1 Tax=uncultured Sulfurovum sp. TaxID=269237 RepID=A0A6S6SNE4_9BACT|nr:MAG: Unknown protein [uncultured Sulfurovum sp.]
MGYAKWVILKVFNVKNKKSWKCPHGSVIEVDGYYRCSSCGDVQNKVEPHPKQHTYQKKPKPVIHKNIIINKRNHSTLPSKPMLNITRKGALLLLALYFLMILLIL